MTSGEKLAQDTLEVVRDTRLHEDPDRFLDAWAGALIAECPLAPIIEAQTVLEFEVATRTYSGPTRLVFDQAVNLLRQARAGKPTPEHEALADEFRAHAAYRSQLDE